MGTRTRSGRIIDKRKVNILIVDDEASIRNVLSEIIEHILKNSNCKEYNIEMTSNGYNALERAKETFFAIALIDINMSKINGVRTFKQIKRISPNTVVIMITGSASDNLLEEAKNEDPYAILHKPFNITVIAQLIEKILPA